MKIELQAPSHAPDFWSGYSATESGMSAVDAAMMPYIIKGPRKQWGLWRNQVNPNMLFPVPEGVISKQLAIKGVKWFKEVINGDVITLIPSL